MIWNESFYDVIKFRQAIKISLVSGLMDGTNNSIILIYMFKNVLVWQLLMNTFKNHPVQPLPMSVSFVLDKESYVSSHMPENRVMWSV